MRPNDPRYRSLALPEAPVVDARLAYVVLNSAVIDPYARYLYAKRKRIAVLVTASEAYFLNEDAMREGNPQGILERHQQAELPPMLIIHGTSDNNVPNEIPERFAAAYRSAGGFVQFEVFPNMPHVFIRQPGPAADRAHTAIKAFILQQLESVALTGR